MATSRAARAGGLAAFAALAREELANRPGRMADALRMTVLTVLVIIVSEIYQIPLTAYSAYVVFFSSRDEKASTAITGVLLIGAMTVAVLTALVMYMASAGEPGLRLPFMSVVAFLGMFSARVSPLGPVAFASGFIVAMALTLIDWIPTMAARSSAELLTRLVMWLWVVASLPLGMVVVANLLTGRRPDELFRKLLVQRLSTAGRLLLGEDVHQLGGHAWLNGFIHSGTVALLRHLKMSGMLDRHPPERTATARALVARTHEMMTLINEWTRLDVRDPDLIAAAKSCGYRLLETSAFWRKADVQPPAHPLPELSGRVWSADPKAALLLERITELLRRISDPRLPAPTEEVYATAVQPQASPGRGLLVEDAFTNPAYVRFALKSTLCIMAAYFIYTLIAWPGIRTVMITCFFVTVGSTGETFHRMVLRIAGAIVGGGLGLASVIFLMPHMTDIGELSLLVGTMAFLTSWVTFGSERLSYAGMQTALAFFMCVLVGYGPTIDLSAARDRVVGVLLGNVIVWLVFTRIWPEGATDKARQGLASALRKLAHLFSQKDFGTGRPPERSDTLVFEFNSALAQSARLFTFSSYEPGRPASRLGAASVGAVQSLLGPALVLDGERPPEPGQCGRTPSEADALCRRGQLVAWLSLLARRASGRMASGRMASGRMASGRMASGRMASGRAAQGVEDHPPESSAPPILPENPVADFDDPDARETLRGRILGRAAWRLALAERARELDSLTRD